MTKINLQSYSALILCFFLGNPSLFAQVVTRLENETAEKFIERIKPDTTELAHPVIETNTWDSSSTAIIALYGWDDPNQVNTGFNEISGHIYLPTGDNSYRDIRFGPMLENGGYPEIIAVFFANADRDRQKELVVLCKLDQRHYDYSGEFYETCIFDNPGPENELAYFEKLSRGFFGCECSYRDKRRPTAARNQTAKPIKAKLQKMGY